MSCVLPVRLLGDPGSAAGFLDLRTGRYAADPSAPPNALSYSWTGRRWLTVGPEMISPDGQHYAYAASDGIHDVDLASGRDRLVLSSPPAETFQYGADGIYLTKHAGYQGDLGLWRVNVGTAAVTQLLPDTVAFDDLGSGAAWYVEPRSEGPAPNTLYRIELGTGTRQVWFSRPNTWAVHLGTDPSGRPLVGWIEHYPQQTIGVMTGPGQATVIQTSDDTGAWIVAVMDAHGVWFDAGATSSPLWLLQPGDRLIAVAQAAVRPLGACQ